MVSKSAYAILSFLVMSCAACVHSGRVHGAESVPDKSTVKIDSGLVSGVLLGEREDLVAYKGIPYAAPPVGDLRWRPPQKVRPWNGIRPCSEYGPSCPQTDLSKNGFSKPGKTSEDCLYLNVWAPRKGGEKLPVMMWIHGGGFVVGSGSDRYCDGEALARQGVAVVTINYRLGPLGFFAHPLLSKESEHDVSGNYGLLDQIAALEWVRRNIDAFGGDPNRVTIFGASAGGTSVCLLMVSPPAKGLFQRAISQSAVMFEDTPSLRESRYDDESAEKAGERFARDLGCDKEQNPLAALRARSVEEIVAKSQGVQHVLGEGGRRFEPVVDGWVIPDDPILLFEAGKQHPVPFIAGTDADEGATFASLLPPMNVNGYRWYARARFRENADEVLALYPASTDYEVRGAISHVLTDSMFSSPAKFLVGRMGKVKPEAKGFLYRFTRVRANDPSSKTGQKQALHGSELPFVFRNLRDGTAAVSEEDEALSNAMSSYWIRFAATGDPNGPNLPEWPPYNNVTRRYNELGDEVQVKADLSRSACDVFEKIALQQRTSRREVTARR